MSNQIANVDIYTWDHCPYCQRALALLDSKSINYRQIRLDGDEEAREAMSQKTLGNRKSVPQIFINDTSYGGCDDLHDLERSGELQRLVFQDA